MTGKPTPPKHFPADLRRWWSWHVEEFLLEESEQQLLTMMGDTWQTYLALGESLKRAGTMTYEDRFGCPKERPEISAMNRARTIFARLRRELNLPIREPEETRLPRLDGSMD